LLKSCHFVEDISATMFKTKKDVNRSIKNKSPTKNDETPSPKGTSDAIKEINLETLSREKYCYEMKRCRLLLERLRNENAQLQAELKSRSAAKPQEKCTVKTEIEKNSNVDKDEVSTDCSQIQQLENESAVEESVNIAELVKTLNLEMDSLLFKIHEYAAKTNHAECWKRMNIVHEVKKRIFDENLMNEIIEREKQLQNASIYYEYLASFIKDYDKMMSDLLNYSPAYYSPTCLAVNPNLLDLDEKANLLKEYIAARPLFKLPYYFGHGTVEQWESLLRYESSFLLFIDSEDNNQLKLMLCDDLSNVLQWPIMQTDSGYFFIKTTDIEKQFLNVDNLMNYHIFQNTNFHWAYFVDENQIEQLDHLLLYNGDFILAEVKNNTTVLQLFYKWNNHIYSMMFNKECKYILPHPANGPEEWVDNLDKLLKSLCACNFRFNNMQLIHPVNVRKRLNLQKKSPVKQNNCDMKNRKPYNPLFNLPYYFGEIEKEYAEQRLKLFADFLLYTDLKTKKLMLAVVAEMGQMEQICHLEIYPNEKHHFCLGNGIDFNTCYLLVPIYRDNYDLHIRVSNNTLSNERCYFGIDFPTESTMDNDDLITVRWEGKIFNIKPKKDTIGYILPKNENVQPTERVKSLNEFAKSALWLWFGYSGLTFHGFRQHTPLMQILFPGQ
ncbi:hypothetical protein T4E_1875, partial [Trichinella pseudospiralis]